MLKSTHFISLSPYDLYYEIGMTSTRMVHCIRRTSGCYSSTSLSKERTLCLNLGRLFHRNRLRESRGRKGSMTAHSPITLPGKMTRARSTRSRSRYLGIKLQLTTRNMQTSTLMSLQRCSRRWCASSTTASPARRTSSTWSASTDRETLNSTVKWPQRLLQWPSKPSPLREWSVVSP